LTFRPAHDWLTLTGQIATAAWYGCALPI